MTRLLLIAALILPAFAQAQIASKGDAELAPDDAAMCVVPDDGAPVAMSLNGTDYTCFVDDISAQRAITNCYCGQRNGEAIYLGVDCAGYAGYHDCCAAKCDVLFDALDAQD